MPYSSFSPSLIAFSQNLVFAQTPVAESAAPAPTSAPTASQPAASQDTLGTGAPSTGAQGTSTPGTPTQPQTPFGGMLWIFALMLGMMVLMTVLSGRKQKKQQQQLAASLKKHDKVLTLGGIIATVDQIRDDEIVLLIDENSRAKMRVTRASIQHILESSSSSSPTDSSQSEIKVKGKNEKSLT